MARGPGQPPCLLGGCSDPEKKPNFQESWLPVTSQDFFTIANVQVNLLGIQRGSEIISFHLQILANLIPGVRIVAEYLLVNSKTEFWEFAIFLYSTYNIVLFSVLLQIGINALWLLKSHWIKVFLWRHFCIFTNRLSSYKKISLLVFHIIICCFLNVMVKLKAFLVLFNVVCN